MQVLNILLLLTGLAVLDAKSCGRISSYAMVYYLATTAMASVTGIDTYEIQVPSCRIYLIKLEVLFNDKAKVHSLRLTIKGVCLTLINEENVIIIHLDIIAFFDKPN